MIRAMVFGGVSNAVASVSNPEVMTIPMVLYTDRSYFGRYFTTILTDEIDFLQNIEKQRIFEVFIFGFYVRLHT